MGKPTARKLVIKNFRVAPKLPEDFEERMWALLSEAVDAVYASKAVATSLETLYKAVEVYIERTAVLVLPHHPCAALLARG